MPAFQGVASDIQILLYPASSLFGTQQQLTISTVRSSPLSLWKNHVSQGSLLCNVLILPCPSSLFWYSPILLIKSIYAFILSAIYLYSQRSPLSEIFYVWCISTAKSRRYPKYFILDHCSAEECSPRLWWS